MAKTLRLKKPETAVASAEPSDQPGSLTKRQEEVLALITSTIIERGYPPSVRELGEALGVSSSATVHSHLQSLVRAGFIRKHPNRSRAIEILDQPTDATVTRFPITPSAEAGVVSENATQTVPLVGSIAAGTNVLAEENVEEIFRLPTNLVGHGNLFMVDVRGDSMEGDGILSGDYAVIRQQPTAENGEIVAALIAEGQEATIKRFHRKGKHVELHSANPQYPTMRFQDGVQILGKVVSIFRRVR